MEGDFEVQKNLKNAAVSNRFLLFMYTAVFQIQDGPQAALSFWGEQ